MFGSFLPRLVTAVPGPRSVELAESLARTECPALTARRARRAERSGAPHDPISWAEARGANVRDVDGNVFVDLTGGFGAALFGHGHPAVLEALSAQEARCLHALGDVHPSDQKVQLLAALSELAPFPARVILGLSGADAVEAALKTAVLHTGRAGVVAFEGGYHGLSHGPLAACGYGEGFRDPFARQLNPHVRFAPFPTREDERAGALAALLGAIDALGAEAGALLLEPIQGRGGVRSAPAGFLAEAARLARARGLVVIVDEIYTGLGRTGRALLHPALGIEADLVCLGKALGGGVPISACLGRSEVMAAWGDPASEAIHTSTFLGNPPACAAALASLTLLRRHGAEVPPREAAFRAALTPIPDVEEVVGEGLLLGVTLRGGAPRVLRVMRLLLERGYIVLPAGAPPTRLCLTPPLTLSDAQLAGFAEALAQSLEASRD
jgi:4-aminobutyrate aminotransferase / (S)-3-amino-2-methylpropionate transaminase / 5-aminovalerate transaminase